MKIKQNDKVIVIAGKDKGTTGTVSRTLSKEGKVIVSGVNTRKKHQKSRSSGKSGEIIEINLPVDVSNVALVDPKNGKPTRVGYKINEDGTKTRISRKSGKHI